MSYLSAPFLLLVTRGIVNSDDVGDQVNDSLNTKPENDEIVEFDLGILEKLTESKSSSEAWINWFFVSVLQYKL